MIFRAFVIDDYPPCRDLLFHLLGSRGYEVLCFADAGFCDACSSSISQCARDTPCADFLLTDNKMPGISGLELLTLQKKGGCKIANANKAILSGAWSAFELDEAASFGCRIFHKPYELPELFSWLDAQEKAVLKKGPRDIE